MFSSVLCLSLVFLCEASVGSSSKLILCKCHELLLLLLVFFFQIYFTLVFLS